jgi:ATP diphosphatase
MVNDAGGTDMKALLAVMRRLRDRDNGCPWDVAQDFNSIAPYTIEEAYEVADAIARDHMPDLAAELGDLLFQVVFHARMAEERGAFCFEDVVRGIVDKMTRRHPHVFGDARVRDAAHQSRTWESIKAEERAGRSGGNDTGDPLADVPVSLPGLQRAAKLQRRAARVGFDWPRAEPVLAKLREEVAELEHEMAAGGDRARLRAELGDVLFTVVNLSRHLDVDAEGALVEANARFARRFRAVCAAAGGAGELGRLSLDELEALWQAVKATRD